MSGKALPFYKQLCSNKYTRSKINSKTPAAESEERSHSACFLLYCLSHCSDCL